MKMPLSNSILILALGALAASAQERSPWTWRRIVPVEGPAPLPRSAGTAIFDPIARRLVIFGGESDQGLLNDVWAFDLLTNSWSELATTGEKPEPRLGANAVYDPNGHQMVIWAGQQGSRFFDDTRALDLQRLEWRDLSPPSGSRPQARYGAGAVFDPFERAMVQFAGFTDLSQRFNDTQVFDLDSLSWEEVGPRRDSARPMMRCLLTAALDPGSRTMIIHGGQRTGPLDDTWAFDLGTRQWTNLTPELRPAGRMLASSFVGPDRRLVVFAGATDAGRVDESWAFDLDRREWTRLEIPDPPPPREAAMSAFVEDEELFLVFGGRGEGRLNDLWVLRRVPTDPSPGSQSYRSLSSSSTIVSGGVRLR
jgi:hypothetical protein